MMRRWLLAALMVWSAAAAFLPAGSAQAFPGRAKWYGYFNNQFNDIGGGCNQGFVLCGGIHPFGGNETNDFIYNIEQMRAGNRGAQTQTGAEFIIETMMGRAP